jgi:membrane-bound lytic murein transglycosylase D
MARSSAPPAAGIALALATAACVGLGKEAPEPPGPAVEPLAEEVRERMRDRAARTRLHPGTIAPLSIEVQGIDPVLHTRIALDPTLRARVDFWIGLWTSREAGHFERYLERMGRYEELVDRELERRGFPRSLRYLPIVESGYRSGAVSRVGATGLWQIMAPTARGLDLTVSSIVDDRRDPVVATRAALDYLEELHRLFGSWYLALAAYNGGPGRVRAMLARHAPEETLSGDERFLLIHPYLPPETRDFVPKLFAAALLARDPEANGIVRPERRSSLAFDEVFVPDATSMDVVARAAGVDESEVIELNPQYLRGFTPVGETRVVRVPAGSGVDFERRYAEIPPGERLSFLEHVVAPGETFTHIARRYRVPLAELLAANARVDPQRLQIGARVVVPVGGRRASES